MGTLITGRRTGARQTGFSLLMTLLSLLILSLSAMAMMSLLKAGVTTSGNIAFRQAAVRVADVAVQDAVDWVLLQTDEYLKTDHVDQGYYATWDPTFSPAGYPFADATKARNHGAKVSGYDLFYVIHRMSVASGRCEDIVAGQGCMFPPAVTVSETRQGEDFGGGSTSGGNFTSVKGGVYYRVTVKVAGPRYNNRYVQAFFFKY